MPLDPSGQDDVEAVPLQVVSGLPDPGHVRREILAFDVGPSVVLDLEVEQVDHNLLPGSRELFESDMGIVLPVSGRGDVGSLLGDEYDFQLVNTPW